MDLLEPPERKPPIRLDLLTERLRASGHLGTGRVSAIESKRSFDTVFAHFHSLRVRYEGEGPDAPADLMLKQSRNELWGGFEATFYGEIAPATVDPAVPDCYGISNDPNGKGSFLLLQDLTDTHQWAFRAFDRPPDEARCREILAELLKFHTQWWESPRLAQDDFMQLRPGNLRMSQAATADLVRRNCREFAEVELPRFADRYGDEFPKHRRKTCEEILGRWEGLFVPRIESGRALTLVHGDPHKSNLFLPREPDRDRIIWLDWQTYVRGIGPYDVAYWLFATQTPESRRAVEAPLLEWYHEQLLQGGVEGYDRDACGHDYRLAVIMNVFAPLVWQNLPLLERALQAFDDSSCEELL